MSQKPFIVNLFMYFLKWGNLGDTTGIPTFIRSVITLIALFFLFILLFSGCQKSEPYSETSVQITTFPEGDDLVNPNPNAKRGKGKGKGQLPPPTITWDVLTPIIDEEINLSSTPTGGCTYLQWDFQPLADTGYSIRILDDCYCSTTQVDSLTIPGETHYIKYWNAFTPEAYMGCLYEIGKDKTYEIRLAWWHYNYNDTTLQPYYSKIYSVYVD